MNQSPKIETIFYKAIFKNISCHINMQESNKFAIIIRIGKHQSKYTQKKNIDNFDLNFEEQLQVEIQQKDLHKTHRSQKCQYMLYKFKEYQGKQNRQLIGMASMSLNSIKFQQVKKRIRLTNSIDRQAYIELTFFIKKQEICSYQEQNNSKVSSPNHHEDAKSIKSIKSIQIKIPQQKCKINNFSNSMQKQTNEFKQCNKNIQISGYNSRYSSYSNNEFYNNHFQNSPGHQQTLKQQRSVDLISSLQDQIDILNNKLQNSQKQLVQIKKSKNDIHNQSKKINETTKKTQELQRQNNILRNKLLQIQKNIKTKKSNSLNCDLMEVCANQNKDYFSKASQNYFSSGQNYFSEGSQRQTNRKNQQQKQKKTNFFEKYTFQAETTDEVMKKQDQNQKKLLGFDFRSNQGSNPNLMEASSPYFKISHKETSINKNKCQNVMQFIYVPVQKQQQNINNSVSKIQKFNYKEYLKFQGKGKGSSKHKIIGYIKNDNNNSFLSGSQHESVVSKANTNNKYRSVNFQIPNSDEDNQSIINIVSPIQEEQIRCSIDPRNDQHQITLQQFNKQTQQFRKRQKALRKANQKFLIQNRKLKKQRQQLIENNRLSLIRSQNAQHQQFTLLKLQNQKLQEEIKIKQQKITTLTKKYELYLTQNNKLKNDMKSHLKTIKQYRLALYSKDQQNKQEELKVFKIQSNSTSSKNSIQKYQKKNIGIDSQSIASQSFHKKCDSARSYKEGFFSSHVVSNKVSNISPIQTDIPRQLKKSCSSKGIAQIKMHTPNSPNIPKPPNKNALNKNGFDNFAEQDEFIRNRNVTTNSAKNIGNFGKILKGLNQHTDK